jgi:hypothetical protein
MLSEVGKDLCVSVLTVFSISKYPLEAPSAQKAYQYSLYRMRAKRLRNTILTLFKASTYFTSIMSHRASIAEII